MAQVLDETGALGQGDELVRRNQTVLGVLPANQGFDADAAIVAQADFGLVVQGQLVTLDRPTQVADHRQPIGAVLVLVG